MKQSLKNLMKVFEYEDKRVSHLLGMFDDYVRFIEDYDGEFDYDDKDHEVAMLASYRNAAFGVLLSLLQLGHITIADFHHRMHVLTTVYFNRVGY